jgi:hypothetical protein
MKMARWVYAAAGAAVLAAGFALPASAAVADGGGNGNSGVLSVLSGNTVNAPVSLPVNVCGVAVTLLGGANAGCAGGASSTTVVGNGGSGGGNGNAGVASIGSGNTVNAPVSAPVSLCGVSAAVGGFANSGCKGGSHSTTVVGGGNGGGNGNSGQFSILSGNTVNAPVSVPVNLCSISLGLLGFANSGCVGGSHSTVIVSCTQNCQTTPPSCTQNCQTTPPSCMQNCQTTPPSCMQNCQTTPPSCTQNCQTTPPSCTQNCQTTPPSCTQNCQTSPPVPSTQVMPTPPTGGGTPPGTGTTTVPGTLPITGANILGMLAAAVASVGIGATLVIARRRRHGA